jgi:hypothetical protein
MTVPHPTLYAPRLIFEAVAYFATDGQEQIVLRGQLGANTKEINGVVVYMQQRAAGASEFTDVAQMTTRPVIMSGPGRFWSREATLAEGMSYRAISQGRSDAVVLAPRVRTVMATPALELWKMRGLRNGTLRLGRRVVAVGRAAPSWLVGETVRLTLKKGPDRHQRVVRRVERTIRDGGVSGDFQWTFTPKTRGEYALYARWLATDEHPGVSAIEAWFHVK